MERQITQNSVTDYEVKTREGSHVVTNGKNELEVDSLEEGRELADLLGRLFGKEK